MIVMPKHQYSTLVQRLYRGTPTCADIFWLIIGNSFLSRTLVDTSTPIKVHHDEEADSSRRTMELEISIQEPQP